MTETQIRDAIKNISLTNNFTGYEGFCFRNVHPPFADKFGIRSAIGSLIVGGRFNFEGYFGALYLSETPLICLEETTKFTENSLRISPSHAKKYSADSLPRMVVGFHVKCSKVLDLRDNTILGLIGVAEDEITGTDWQEEQGNGNEAITQIIGRLAKDAGFEAILAPSARCIGTNIIVFGENLFDSSSVQVIGLEKLYSNASWMRLPNVIIGESKTISLVNKIDDRFGLNSDYLEIVDEYCDRAKELTFRRMPRTTSMDSVLDNCLKMVKI